MSDKPKYNDLTREEFEYELRDHRKAAYAEYLRFAEERKARKAAFDAAQAQRNTVCRWLHALVQAVRNHQDEQRAAELLREADRHGGEK